MNILIYTRDFDLPTFIKKLGKQLSLNGHKVTFMGHSSKLLTHFSGSHQIGYYPLPLKEQTASIFISCLKIGIQLLFKRLKAIPGIFKTLKQDYHQNKNYKGRKEWLVNFIRLGACKLIKPDVIHNQWSPALAHLQPLFDHYPIVQSLHGRLEDVTPFHDSAIANIYKKFFPQVKGFQSASRHLLNNANLFGAKNDNTFISYSLIEKEQIEKQATKQSSDANLKIISIGKFVWRKGFTHALDAMAMLKARGVAFQYTIVGWDDATPIKFHIADLQLQEEVELKANLTHDETLAQLKQADLFLLSSVEEGFATVVTEAMALHKPVISTNCGGMGELIVNDKNGWLIPTRDPKAITDAVGHFLQLSSTDIEKITNNAKQLVEDQLTWEHQIDQIVKLYQNSLQQ